MYTLSTYYIKSQVPHADIKDILRLYQHELYLHGVNNIDVDYTHNALYFSNHKFNISSYRRRYSGFSHGNIEVTDDDIEYTVTLKASLDNIPIMPGIAAACVALISLVISNFNLVALIIPTILFVLLIIIRWLDAYVILPIYFENLRIRLNRELQEGV